jgi:hypothetical protein
MGRMSDAEPRAEHGRGPVRRIVDHLRHHRDEGSAVDDELTRDAELAGYDLGADLAHPSPRHEIAGFDVDTDIGRENEPPELRR